MFIFKDEIRNDVYHSLFSDGQLISGCEDSANSFARGYCTVGREILIPTLRAIEAIVEQCEDFVGFIIMHSMGGGTGSGFTTLLMESLKEMYEKKTILEFAVYPSPKVYDDTLFYNILLFILVVKANYYKLSAEISNFLLII